MPSTPDRGYAPLAKAVHWLTAFGVLFTIPAGISMVNLSQGPLQNTLYNLHRSVGFVVLVLACCRLATRIAYGKPPPHPSLSRFQRIASEGAHRALFALIFIVPLLGWAGTSAFGAPISVFGLFVLPPILSVDQALAKVLLRAHTVFAILMTAILCAHIGAALYHGVIRRDGVLSRMLPGRARR
ncbi:MAG: cytochrome b [Alphaproteobacteria bacterium]|nr:cytochrome b [Alphaproteobacteria bacterium]